MEQIDTLTKQVGPVMVESCPYVQQIMLLPLLQSATCDVQIQQASTLLVGCPACDHNFKHFFCTLTCHPDQSTFVNVTDVQLTVDTNRTAVKEVNSCPVR